MSFRDTRYKIPDTKQFEKTKPIHSTHSAMLRPGFAQDMFAGLWPEIRNLKLMIKKKMNRVGGGITPAVLPHHRTYGSVYGGFRHRSWYRLSASCPISTQFYLTDSVRYFKLYALLMRHLQKTIWTSAQSLWQIQPFVPKGLLWPRLTSVRPYGRFTMVVANSRRTDLPG